MQKWLKYKNEHHYSVLATFSGLGGSGWRLSGLSWGILARSWAILGDLGVKLGPYGSMLEERWRRRAKICELGAKFVKIAKNMKIGRFYVAKVKIA